MVLPCFCHYYSDGCFLTVFFLALYDVRERSLLGSHQAHSVGCEHRRSTFILLKPPVYTKKSMTRKVGLKEEEEPKQIIDQGCQTHFTV